ncbi:MAG: glycosyltransferase family 4 protein [Saprospiraceae bacterium]
MKILFVSNSAWNLYNFRAPIIKAFIKDSIQVNCLCKFDNYELELKKMGCGELINLKSILARGKNPFKDLKLLFEIHKAYKSLQPDLIFLFTPKLNIYGGIAATFGGRQYVNNITGLGSEFKLELGFPIYLKMLYRMAMKNAFCVVSHNLVDLDYLIGQNITNKSKSIVIPGSGINTEYFQPNKKISSVKRFLFMGRLLKEKGIVEFIEAAQILSRQNPDLRFRIVGNNYGVKDEKLDNLLNGLREHSSFEFLDFTNDPKKEYEESDCFVLPSFREGMSKSLLEAMAMSRLVIATKVPGCQEAIQEDVNGFLSIVGDRESLLKNMKRVIELDMESIEQVCNNARNTIQTYYCEEIIAAQYLKIIEAFKLNYSKA